MTTPQYKFFDTVKKEWSHTEYLIYPAIYEKTNGRNCYDICAWEEGDPQPTYSPDIIAVPFTGFYDKKSTPAYEDDIVKTSEGEIGRIFKDRTGEWFINSESLPSLCYYVDSVINDWMEIIGSSLTNPELLDD